MNTTTKTTPKTLPELGKNHPTGHWQNNWNNPAEDHWLVRSDSFVGEEAGHRTTDFRETRRWLADRYHFSATMGEMIDKGFEDSEFQVTIRPCNFRAQFMSEIISLRRINYSLLAAVFLDDREVYDPASTAADKDLLAIQEQLIGIEQEWRPSHFIISYDDDYSLLASCAKTDPEFYQRYCRAKGLVRT